MTMSPPDGPASRPTDVLSIDPRTGETIQVVARETAPTEVGQRCAAALAAAPALDRLGRTGRAGLLDTLADALEARRDEIVAVADRETALGATRLDGELTRTCHQLRLFAEVVREGSYLEAAIDHAGDTPMGPRPDLRRMLVPLGPVAVFGASNFPLAFSVPGGDTASALAAGCRSCWSSCVRRSPAAGGILSAKITASVTRRRSALPCSDARGDPASAGRRSGRSLKAENDRLQPDTSASALYEDGGWGKGSDCSFFVLLAAGS
jgi:acyl-CoA reductase-like NAD-dependent aldehyde dehydrogenase